MLELPTPIVIGLNMVDVAATKGIKVEAVVLAAALGVPVVPDVATRAEGIGALVAAAAEIIDNAGESQPRRPHFDSQMETLVGRVSGPITGFEPTTHPLRWVATKLLKGDAAVHGLAECLSGIRGSSCGGCAITQSARGWSLTARGQRLIAHSA